MLTDATLDASTLMHWARMPGWRTSEAAALLLLIEPRLARSRRLTLAKKREYEELRTLLLRSRSMGLLKTPLHPREFVEWAQTNRIKVPDGIVQAVAATEPLRDWRMDALKYEAQLRDLEKYPRVAAEVDELDAKSQKSLFRILVCMATDKYGYHPFKNNNAASTIAKLISEAEYDGPEAQTVRTWLKRAYEAIRQDL